MTDWSRFKTEINLTQYAAHLGYEIVKKDSTRSSIKMRKGSDIVIISKKGGTWVYFSVSDGADNGAIVNFIQNRTCKSLPEIAKELLEWLGEDGKIIDLKYYASDIEEQVYDPARIKNIFKSCKKVKYHPYLESRGITSALLSSERFIGRIYEDRYENAVFPHYNVDGICGLELKNKDKAIFVRGSEKTFWRSNILPSDNALIISEAVIDALSYQEIFKLEIAHYFATGGGMSPEQAKLLTEYASNNPEIKKIIMITDNDLGGDKLCEKIRPAISASKFTGELKRHSTRVIGDDWNDELKNS